MALILVDTSVWIDFFHSTQSEEAKRLAEYLEGDRVCITSLIRAEILSGARNEKEFNLLKENLSALPILEEPQGFWDQVAHFRFLLARRGIQSSLIDLSIGVLAYHHNCFLLTRDKEFKQIAHILPIKLHNLD